MESLGICVGAVLPGEMGSMEGLHGKEKAQEAYGVVARRLLLEQRERVGQNG